MFVFLSQCARYLLYGCRVVGRLVGVLSRKEWAGDNYWGGGGGGEEGGRGTSTSLGSASVVGDRAWRW